MRQINRREYRLDFKTSTLGSLFNREKARESDVIFSLYGLFYSRVMNFEPFLIGAAENGGIVPIPLEIGGQEPAHEAFEAVLCTRENALAKLSGVSLSVDSQGDDGQKEGGQNYAGRNYAALFGVSGSESWLEQNIAAGHTAAVYTPSAEAARGGGNNTQSGVKDISNAIPGTTSGFLPAFLPIAMPPGEDFIEPTQTMTYFYDADMFSNSQIFIRHMQFESFLQDLAANPRKPLNALSMISKYERSVIDGVNNTDTNFSSGKCIHDLFEDVTARNPDAPALRFGGNEMSYGELNDKANRLAKSLCDKGARPGAYVAIAAERGYELIAAMLAVLKSGAAFVPLSLRYPPEFMATILRHCGAKLFLTTAPEAAAASLPEGVQAIDLLSPGSYDGNGSALPCPNGLSPQSRAALIYTSGTTGLPKGVLVRHDTIVNYCEFNVREFGISENDNIMQFAPFPFSTAILEITTTLIGGAKLCLVTDAAVMDPRAFYKEMLEARATCLLAPPDYVAYIPLPDTLRIVETGASECSPEVSGKIARTTRHVNCYGLTEGSVPVIWKEDGRKSGAQALRLAEAPYVVQGLATAGAEAAAGGGSGSGGGIGGGSGDGSADSGGDSGGGIGVDDARLIRVPIGKPVPNTKIYILDENGHQCGMYMPGELCITGLAVSDGYLGDPDRTAERFVNNPYGGGAMLRTGDIVHWNAEGDVEYLGRVDNQVKIRGMRVELEEVDRALKMQQGVSGAAAIPKRMANGDTQIVAFVTLAAAPAAAAGAPATPAAPGAGSTPATPGTPAAPGVSSKPATPGMPGAGSTPAASGIVPTISPESIRAELYKILLEHKVPSIIAIIDKIPMTPNGKVDKRALSAIETGPEKVEAPMNREEALCVTVFEKVLGLSGVGVNESFFALGGHSLRAANAANMLEEASGIRVPLSQWFETPTAAGLAQFVRAALEGKSPRPAVRYQPIPVAESSLSYPMSPAQRRMFLASQINGAGTDYNIPVALEFKGPLDKAKLRSAVGTLIERHEALRTGFRIESERAAGQSTIGQASTGQSTTGQDATGQDATGQSTSDRPAAASAFSQFIVSPGDAHADIEFVPLRPEDSPESLLAGFVKPFGLSLPPLMRICAAIAEDGSRSVLMVDIHHIVADARTLNILLEEFETLYNGDPLEGRLLQYKDFSQWSAGRGFGSQKAYWASVFETPAPALGITTDYTRPRIQNNAGEEIEITIGADLRQKIEALSDSAMATPFMTMLSALMVMLGKYANQDDITVGVPVSGRIHRDTENIAGMFVNTLPLRGYPSGEKTFLDFFGEIRHTCLQAFENQEYPYEEMVGDLAIPRDLSVNPLFEVVLAFQNTETYPANPHGLDYVRTALGLGAARYDMSFEVTDADGCYNIKLIYRTALFRSATAHRMLRHYAALLEGIANEPSLAINSLLLTDAEEYRQVVQIFSGAERNAQMAASQQKAAKPHEAVGSHETIGSHETLGSHESVISMFRAMVKKYPEHSALIYKEKHMTYAELDAKTDRVAAWLSNLGIGPEDIVAVCCGRGFGSTVGAIGAMKAGAAYQPIDASARLGRTLFMINDSGAKALLHSGGGAEAGAWQGSYINEELLKNTQLPSLDVMDAAALSDKPNAPPVRIQPSSPAYCIYTSGSTGEPKGVLIEHRSLANLARYYQAEFLISHDDTVLQFANAAFDVSVSEMTMALTNGAALMLTSEAAAAGDPTELGEHLRNSTIASLSPELAAAIKPSGLRLLFTGGSEAIAETARFTFAHNGTFYNMYGPTEATILASTWTCADGEEIPEKVPIGKPITGALIYILDGLSPCGIGVPGELCIGGAGVGRGYINRPQLNEEKFIENPFAGGRLYRSGDWARWLPDGNIEFLGRIDEQLKVRGFRVEPGEIENAMYKHPGVREAAAVALGTDLIGYIAADPGFDTAALKMGLGEYLPDYMTPSRIILMGELPKTQSGKIDKRSLPVPEAARAAERPAGSPRSREEALVSWVFGEVLDTGPVGINDNFFELGGNSLRVINAVNMIESLSGVRLSIRNVFESPTVEGLALALREVSNPSA